MWGASLSWDYPLGGDDPALMDAKILPGYAAIERGSIFGYAFFVYEQSKGVIGDLFVSGTMRNTRAETAARDSIAAKWKNGYSLTSSKRCSSRPESIAWRRNCSRTKREKWLGRSCSRVSAAIRAVFMNFDIGKHPQPRRLWRRSSKSVPGQRRSTRLRPR